MLTCRKGALRSQRGIGGGISLVKSPSELTILAVVNPSIPSAIQTCPLGLAAHGVRLCPLHKRMDNALATALAEVLAVPTKSVPLCNFPVMKDARPS